MWKLKSFGSLRNINKTGNLNVWNEWLTCLLSRFLFCSMCPYPSLVTSLDYRKWVWVFLCVFLSLSNIIILRRYIRLRTRWVFLLIPSSRVNNCCSRPNRRGELRLHHHIKHRTELAFRSPKSRGQRRLGSGHRKPDPCKSTELWEQK